MEGGEELEPMAEVMAHAMAEGERLARGHASQRAQERDEGVLAHLAQGQDRAQAAQEAPFARQVLAAAADLLR